MLNQDKITMHTTEDVLIGYDILDANRKLAWNNRKLLINSESWLSISWAQLLRKNITGGKNDSELGNSFSIGAMQETW